ncbi:MAG: 16S rRNA (guanine(527)-N(7))-methyltransferase RsmG [Planctomycetia bacterium]|nr:16S rRNA (guanine(527)-N(7))-methyltransferase RsmG [Planctomycetia bacterium]
MTDENNATLSDVLQKYEIEISPEQTEMLEKFCELLWGWNEKINLTRHTNFEKFVTRDLIDTMALSEFLAPGEKVLDVGSGSGVPGILLGILRPDINVSLAECVGKKAKVLAEMVHALELPVVVFEGLAQDLLGTWQFHTLTFRAVASMKKLLEWFRGKWIHFDRMLLVKGPKWMNERGEARHYSLFNELSLRKLKEYVIPGTDSDQPQSFILQICPKAKLGKDDLCELSSWETSKSRSRYGGGPRKSRVENDERPTKKSRVADSHRIHQIRNSIHRKSRSGKRDSDEE